MSSKKQATGSKPAKSTGAANTKKDEASASNPPASPGCEGDEELARRMQQEWLEEDDAQLARRLQDEDRGPCQHVFMPVGPNGRPMSATPLRLLFNSLMRQQLQPDIDADEEDTPAMEPEPDTEVPAPPSTGATSPRRGASRSPERPPRRGLGLRFTGERGGRGRGGVEAQGRGRGSDGLPQPGDHPNPAQRRMVIFGNRNRQQPDQPDQEETGGTETSEPAHQNQQNWRPIVVRGPGGVPAFIRPPPSLPVGEFDPDFLLANPSAGQSSPGGGEDRFVQMMRDPFLLLLMLMGRDPGMLIPDDVDLDNYESLLDLAERLGDVRARGLSEDVIKKIPVRSFTKKQRADDCRVCMSAYEDKEKIMTLPCKHEYHASCASEWLKRNASCPICRQELDLKTGKKKEVQRR